MSPKHGTPAPSVWLIVAASIAAMLWTKAVPVVTSLSTVALYLAYTIPIALAWRARRAGSDWPVQAVWRLGRFGAPLNLIAMMFAAFICVVLIMPPNELAGKTLAALLGGLGLLYFTVVRSRFRGPDWSRREH